MRRSEENGASRPHRTYLVGGGRQHSLWGVADEDVGAPGVAFIRRDLRHSRMTQIPANKSHPGSADVLVGHAPQGVLASPPHQVGSMRARCTILLGTAHSRLKFGPTRRSALQTFAFHVSGLPPSLPLMSPFGLPLAGYPASTRWHVFRFLLLSVSL